MLKLLVFGAIALLASAAAVPSWDAWNRWLDFAIAIVVLYFIDYAAYRQGYRAGQGGGGDG